MTALVAFTETAKGRDVSSLTIVDDDTILGDDLFVTSGPGDVTHIYVITVTADPTGYVDCDTVAGTGGLADLAFNLRAAEIMHYDPPSSLDSGDTPDPVFLRVTTWMAPWVNTGPPGPCQVVANFDGSAQDAIVILAGVTGSLGFDARVSNPNTSANDTGDDVVAQSFSNGILEEAGGMLISFIATSGPTDPVPNAPDQDEVVSVETATLESDPSTTPIRAVLSKVDLAFGSSGWLLGTENAVRNWILTNDAFATGVPDSDVALPAVTVVALF